MNHLNSTNSLTFRTLDSTSNQVLLKIKYHPLSPKEIKGMDERSQHEIMYFFSEEGKRCKVLIFHFFLLSMNPFTNNRSSWHPLLVLHVQSYCYKNYHLFSAGSLLLVQIFMLSILFFLSTIRNKIIKLFLERSISSFKSKASFLTTGIWKDAPNPALQLEVCPARPGQWLCPCTQHWAGHTSNPVFSFWLLMTRRTLRC